MKVLITGGAGYIGSVLVRQLLQQHYQVRVLDILNFGGESLLSVINHPDFEFIKGDVRNKKDISAGIKGIDAVVHLAAIVGDPACAADPVTAQQTNYDASVQLYDTCRDSGHVKRFIFASTCSNYGKMAGEDYIDETSPLNPVSLYAKLKVEFEKYLLESKTPDYFVPTALRFATVYGISPRMRFDLTVNEFTRDSSLGKELIIYGKQFWRPYCHVDDLARSCVLILESAVNKVNHEVFGVGNTQENYQKEMLVTEIQKIIPDVQIKYVHKKEDPRDYKVKFSKIEKQLGFNITKTVPQGIREINFLIKNGFLADPLNKLYSNT